MWNFYSSSKDARGGARQRSRRGEAVAAKLEAGAKPEVGGEAEMSEAGRRKDVVERRASGSEAGAGSYYADSESTRLSRGEPLIDRDQWVNSFTKNGWPAWTVGRAYRSCMLKALPLTPCFGKLNYSILLTDHAPAAAVQCRQRAAPSQPCSLPRLNGSRRATRTRALSEL